MSIEETSIERILEDAKTSQISNPHFELENIQKYLGCSQVRWLAMHENGMLVAVCGITQSQETSKDLDENGKINEVTFLSTYICQLSSLVSGKSYGKALLEQVLDTFNNDWLRAMPGTEAFYKSVTLKLLRNMLSLQRSIEFTRLHEHTCMHSWNKNSQVKVFVKSDRFAQRICDLVGAV